MPQVDESEQSRQTYGAPAGWSDRQRETPPDQSPAPVTPPESSPDDAVAAPSAEGVQEPVVSEQGLPPAETPESVPFNKHPRWIERQQELERERQRVADLQRQNHLLLETMQRVAPQSPPPQQVDFWDGRLNHPDPATAQYWQQQKQLFDLAVQTGKQSALQEITPLLTAGMQKFAANDLKVFRAENPDILPGSQEETLIIAYMEGRVDGVRHPIESARNNAVIKRLETELHTLRQKQAATPQKRQAANSERSSGIPPASGLPPRPGDWRETAGAIIDKGGDMVDVAKAIFGGKRRLQE